MQALYFFTIYPLELLYSLVYQFFAGLCGSYGYALLLLSLASYFLFAPLKRLTASAQQREAEIQTVLAPQLKKIKAESKGGERQRRINALYRRYAYHPLLGLRLSFGIFMQIPFLCAAYYMLLGLPALHGQPFGLLPDLGSPDGLLWGIHALPLLMTAVNLLALAMSSDLGAAQKRQGLLVALLFLVLLYSSPSALLVYWTGNNVLSALETALNKYRKPLLALLPGNPARKTWTPKLRPESGKRPLYAFSNEAQIYFTSAALFLFIVFIYSPHALLDSGFSPFEKSTAALMIGLVPYALLAALFLVLARLHTPVCLRPAFTLITLFCALVALVYSTINPVDFGSLDVVWLSKGQELASRDAKLADALILPGILAAILLLLHHTKEALLLTFLQCSLVILAGCTGFALFPALEQEKTVPSSTHYSFSKDKNNVAIFFLDMFTGGHIEDIFGSEPALAKRFAGFVWFPDTVAVSSMTSGSGPSMYGGDRYTPPEMDKRPNETLMDKFSEGMAFFAENFIRQGYTVSFEHNDYALNQSYFAENREKGRVRLVTVPREKALAQYGALLEKQVETVDNTNFLLLLGAFKAAPYFLKRTIYGEAKWLGVNAFGPQMENTMYNAARLACLPGLSDTDSPTPTLNFFYNTLPHFSWHLPPDSLVPVPDPYPETKGQLIKVDGLLPEHLFNETHTLRFLADFLDWLRAEGMYDNTMIILASDHCEADSRMLNMALGVTEKGQTEWQVNNAFRGRPHALLMIKDFADNAPFRTDAALMSSQDVPALACTALGDTPGGGCEGISPVYSGPDRVRYHYYGFNSWQQLEIPGKKTYDAYKACIIRGSMFNKEHWTLPE